MIRRRICYLLLLAAGCYFIMLYDFQGLRFLFGCVLCIPFLSFLFLIPACLCCRSRLEAEGEAVPRGELLKAKIMVENKGLLPVSRILVELRWKVPGDREVKVRSWLCGIGMNKREEIFPEIRSMHCGTASMTLAKVRVYDYLGIFSLPAGRRESVEICIIPVVTPIPSAVETAYSQVLQGSGVEREGDMLLRDFQPGDSLRRVYWRMMARGGDLQVRDFERSSSVSLFLHYSAELPERAEEWDKYLDRAASLLYFFAVECRLSMQVSAEAVWRQKDAFFRCVLQDGGAIQAWVCALLRGEAAGTALLEEEVPYLTQGWHLEEDCRLYFGEQCVYEE